MTKKKKITVIVVITAAVLVTVLLMALLINAVASIQNSSYKRVLVKNAQEYIKTDDYFIEKYGQPISVVADPDNEVEWVKDKECIIPCIVKTDSHMTYAVKIRLNYENGNKDYTYDEVVIMKSTV